MKLVDYICAFLKLVESRKHLIKVMNQLEHESYDKIVAQKVKNSKKCSINASVKSYFWAGRTLKKCQCLPRSIALYQNLTAQGYEVHHKMGVNKNNKNLAAHAWVEYKNKPLNESKDLYKRFKPLK